MPPPTVNRRELVSDNRYALTSSIFILQIKAFPSGTRFPMRWPRVPIAHRMLPPKKKDDYRVVIEEVIKSWGGDIPRCDDAFVPNLGFKPFR